MGKLGRKGTHPAVDLELLRVRRFLCRDSLRPGCRGGERPEAAGFKEGRRGPRDGLHGCQTRWGLEYLHLKLPEREGTGDLPDQSGGGCLDVTECRNGHAGRCRQRLKGSSRPV